MFLEGMRPLHTDGRIVAGRAKTKDLEIVRDPERSTIVADREKGSWLVDTCGPGDFLVVGAPQALPYAIWGGHLSLTASLRGAVGVVADGLTRDVAEINKLGFPIWCSGATPVASGYGGYSVRANDVAVTCAGVEVVPGDYLVGDLDGVMVIPADQVEQLLEVCEEMERDEEEARVKIKAGGSMLNSYVSRDYYSSSKKR
jgi:4-hydroxy-4-methyl-2-oxoglutarate aldolase